MHGRATTRVRRDTSAATTERIGRNMRFALLFEDDNPAGPYPLANEDQTIVSGYTYDSLLAAPASAIFAYAIGGQILLEHQALMLGGAFDLFEQIPFGLFQHQRRTTPIWGRWTMLHSG